MPVLNPFKIEKHIAPVFHVPGKDRNMVINGLKKVESGIWRMSGRQAYWVDVQVKGVGRRRELVEGTIHNARARRVTLRESLISKQPGSLKSFASLGRILRFYVLRHYRHTSRWKMGSGQTYHRFWIKTFGKTELLKITVGRVRDAVAIQPWTVATRNAYLGHIRAAWAFALAHGRIDTDMLSDMVLARVPAARPVIIGHDVLDTIQGELPFYLATLMMFKRLVPSRCLELYGLGIDQVDLERSVINLRSDQTKTGQERTIPIPDDLAPWFRWLARMGSPWAFPRIEENQKGTVRFHKLLRNHVGDCWRRIRDKHNLSKDVLFRRLRATAITGWKRLGIDSGLISSTAGVSERVIAQHYDVVEVRAKIDAVNRYGREIGRHQTDTSAKILNLEQFRRAKSA